MSTRDRKDYVEAVLSLYRHLPGTVTRPRPADRLLAAELHRRGLPLDVVEIALRLAAARRIARPADAPPLPPVRSLHYFLPVIEELPAGPAPDGYLDYLRDVVPDKRSATVPNTHRLATTPSPRRPPGQPRLPFPPGAAHENDVS